ncbi:MAG: T9SS type A sorting domain-containing protein [Flavobacteriales bacterium]|nr:T9SS type A sorting domain-containing protein [Flavobacteriales bacterium]
MRSGDLVTRDTVNSLIHELVLDSGAVVIDSQATSNVGATPSSYINGPVSIVTSQANDTLVFPIGKDGSYRDTEVIIYNSTYVRDTLKAELFHSSSDSLYNTIPSSPEAILNVSDVHWWRVETKSTFLHDSARVKLSYSPDGSGDWITDPLGLRMMLAPIGGNSSWTNISPARGSIPTGASAGYIYSDAITSFGELTFGNASTNPLPVELVDFSVRLANKKAILNWTTASEINSSHFDVFHSKNGEEFELAGKVYSAGNSSNIQAYSFMHDELNNGYNYYRLIQIDHDGTSEDLGTRVLWYQGQEINVYPNPFFEEIRIDFPKRYPGELYRIFDSTGRVVLSGRLDPNSSMIFGAELLSGHYTLVLESEDHIINRFTLFKL